VRPQQRRRRRHARYLAPDGAQDPSPGSARENLRRLLDHPACPMGANDGQRKFQSLGREMRRILTNRMVVFGLAASKATVLRGSRSRHMMRRQGMPVNRERWTEGTPSRVVLTPADIDKAQTFYQGLFGWEYDKPSEQHGPYVTARLNGDVVAALEPALGNDSPAPRWVTYIAADDAATVTSRITALGGSILVPPTKIASDGSMAVVADPGGAVFGLWQAEGLIGVERYNEPGALFWNEARVRDYDAGRTFYADVFNYRFTDIGGEGVELSMYTLGETAHNVGGIGPVAALGENVPPHWRTCFFVADVDAACVKAKELGGDVLAEPWPVLEATMAHLVAPGGETFLVGWRPDVHDYARASARLSS
jgi:predicted enzyme related to lactoylglutathione lyase